MPSEQKNVLANALRPKVASLTDKAIEVIGMLMELDNTELLQMLTDRARLESRTREAAELLQRPAAEAGQPTEEATDTDREAARREPAVAAPPTYALTPDRPATTDSQRTPDTDQYEQDFYTDTNRQAVQQARAELVQKMHEETLKRERHQRRQQPPDHAHDNAQGQEEDLPPTQAYGPTAELIDVMAEVTASQQRHAEELAKQEEQRVTTQAPPTPPQGDTPTCSPTVPFVPQPVPPQPG